MMNSFSSIFKKIDLIFFILPILLSIFSISTLFHFAGNNSLFYKTLFIDCVGVLLFFLCLKIDFSFFKNSNFAFWFYILTVLLLVIILLLGTVTNNAQSWFKIFGVSLQPVEFAKLGLIVVLAKYFDKRHVNIAHIPNLLISFFYISIPFFLTLKQPDLGSALVLLFIWLTVVFVSGIPKKYIIFLGLSAVVVSGIAWIFLLKDFQKARINTFLYPEQDRLGSGYNVYQAQIAIGSGGVFGKGISLGTQSNLSYLPEYETDFIFAAFAEEWGFVGSLFLILIFLFLIFKIIIYATNAKSNFDTFIMIGVVAYFFVHFTINVGMNIGIIPVTGIPLPFVSAGGTHVLLEWIMLGIVMSLVLHSKNLQSRNLKVNEFNVL